MSGSVITNVLTTGVLSIPGHAAGGFRAVLRRRCRSVCVYRVAY
ncbi:MAG: hypothetical protein MH208_18945 [Marinobacter sp.]|nr:hypothetical protein [Marinobacter sp.]